MSEPRAEPECTAEFSDIVTQWSLVLVAHQGSATLAGRARNELVLKYRRAIRGYLGAILQDDHAADELAQDVVLRLLSGDFASATPEKGRFRNYLKVAVRNMARSYWHARKRDPTTGLDAAGLAVAADETHDDFLWDQDWRTNVLHSAWAALKQHELGTRGNVFHTLLRLRSENPELDSLELARRLTEQTGTAYTAANVRQQLRRAKFRFAQLVVEEVARSLDWPVPEEVEQELVDLGLIKYVRDFLPPDWKTKGELRDVPE
jgi:DNA-directed RNA polymerase specialized sigma24 family protein